MNKEDDKTPEFHEFSNLDDLMEFVANRAKKRTGAEERRDIVRGQASLKRDTIMQQLRLALQAQVEDPTAKLTETGYACAIAAAIAGPRAVMDCLKDTDPHTDPFILKSIAEHLHAIADLMIANPCTCPRCQL